MSISRALAVLHYSILSSALLAFMFVLAGCEPSHCYDGPHLTKNKLAFVSVETKETYYDEDDDENPASIKITYVDNKIPRDYDVNDHSASFDNFFVLPGYHKFFIKYHGPSLKTKKIALSLIYDITHNYDRFDAEVEFYAEASHEYAIHFKEKEKLYGDIVDVNYWVEDVNYCDATDSMLHRAFHCRVRCGNPIPSITTRTKDITKTK